MPKLYTVKEAAAIVGVSTNTLYKYLLEGKIKSARGTAKQGRFRIPHSSLEAFLGTNIALEEPVVPTPTSVAVASETVTPTPPPSVAKTSTRKKSVRILVFLGLVALIADLLLNPTWNIASGILRILIFATFIMLAYRPRTHV